MHGKRRTPRPSARRAPDVVAAPDAILDAAEGNSILAAGNVGAPTVARILARRGSGADDRRAVDARF